jgi:hypothetical protein
VEHVRVYPAYCRPLFINPAPAVFEKVTGSFRIPECPDRIPGSIVCPMLVAEIREGDRFQRFRFTGPDPRGILVKEKDMAVEFPRAAARAAVTMESDIGENGGKFHGRIIRQCLDLAVP